MYQSKNVEKIQTDILCSITYSEKSCRLWGKCGKIWYSQTWHR